MGALADQCPRLNKTMFVVNLECEYKEREALEEKKHKWGDDYFLCSGSPPKNAAFRCG